jgi:Transposase
MTATLSHQDPVRNLRGAALDQVFGQFRYLTVPLEGAARGAPLAIQVADRWHLLHNLAEAVERAVARHKPCLRDEPAPCQSAPAIPAAAEGPRTQKTRARHTQVHAALSRGLNLTEISAILHLDRTTVRRYASACDPGGLLGDSPVPRPGLLDPHLPYLRERWDEGCHRAEKLYEEIHARGYRGSLRTLRRHTAGLREAKARPAPPAPASKTVAAWILTPPGSLPGEDRAALARITGRCDELATVRSMVREFADMLCNRTGRKLPGWADQAEASSIRELRTFAAGLRKDWAAVTAGLTLPYSSGAVEGHVNRIKMIKRQMYGRAKPDLLRKRVLLAD